MHRAIDALVSGLLFLITVFSIVNSFLVAEINTARVSRDSSLVDLAEGAADYMVAYLGRDAGNWLSKDIIRDALNSYIDSIGLEGSGFGFLVKVTYFRYRNEYTGQTIIVISEKGVIVSDRLSAASGFPHATASRSVIVSRDGKNILVNLIVVAYRSG